MYSIKLAKILFCFAVLLFVAKPFLGFTLFSRLHPPAEENIFVKVFTKRKLENSENSDFSMSAIQKKMADAAQRFILRLSFLLSIIFPAVCADTLNMSNYVLNGLRLSALPPHPSYLLNSKLII